MASILAEDFQQLQVQLIELRSNNYNLDEQCRKQNTENQNLKQQLEDLEKELSKVQKALNRSKKARDVEQLLQENDHLQRKLQNQEDEFRLQNETLMQELSSLVASNEKLERELEISRTRNDNENMPERNNVLQEELCRLRAENVAFQKSITDLRKVNENGVISCESPLPDAQESQNVEFILKQLREDLTETKLKLDTEVEEKKLLKERHSNVEEELFSKLRKLEDECSKTNEKLKKKQESIQCLQEEKEKMFNEHQQIYDQLRSDNTSEVEQLKELVQRLQQQVSSNSNSQQEYKTTMENSVSELQETIALLQQENEKHNEEEVNLLKAQNASLESRLEELTRLSSGTKTENQLLQCQMEESQTLVEKLQENLSSAESENREKEEALIEAQKLAEKRKTLLDQMAVHLQDVKDTHKQESDARDATFNQRISALSAELDEERERSNDVPRLRSEADRVKGEVENLMRLVEQLQGELEEQTKALAAAKECYAATLEQTNHRHDGALMQMKDNFELQIMKLRTELEEVNELKGTLESEVWKLQQDIKDGIEERKIQEKKGLSMVKELKKQLQGERRRAEKLQEKLQELLNESSTGRIDDILPQLSNGERLKGDASSVSSWSFMSGNLENSRPESKESTAAEEGSQPDQTPPDTTSMAEEHQDLLERITSLQQEKWVLEEKLNHLEMSNAAMADDIMKKTAIIQFYCMEGRSDPRHLPASDRMTVKRVVDFIKDKGDENLRETNRRMQRMLEETLTKNMHLQKDMETLSNEVVRLSQNPSPKLNCIDASFSKLED